MSDGKTWIMVTGATGGIGKALVARLAVEGRNVIATAREPERVSGTTGSRRIVGVGLDMERPDTIAAAAGDAAKLTGSAVCPVWSIWLALSSKARSRLFRRRSCGANWTLMLSVLWLSRRLCCRFSKRRAAG